MRLSIGVLAGLLLLTVPTLAHHSFTNFWDLNETREIEGVVKSLKLVNPAFRAHPRSH